MKKNTPDLSSLLYGYIPPHNDEVEKGILGAMMFFEETVKLVREKIQPADFYSEATRSICAAIFDLDEGNVIPEAYLVVSYLKDNGMLDIAGGPYEVIKCMDRPVKDIDASCKLIKQLSLQRQMVTLAQDMIGSSLQGEDVFTLIEQFRQEMDGINQYMNSQGGNSLDGIALETAKATIDRQITEDPIYTFIEGWDALNGELFAGGLYFIAARPGMGKCLGKGTKVIMFDGTHKAVEDLRVGDRLMGVDSKPRTILSLARGMENMYWVRQRVGIDYRVNESHILSLKRSRTEWCHTNGDVLNISVREYLEKSEKFKTNYKGYKTGFEMPERKVLINPYLMGCWIGDGGVHKPIITAMDKEVIEAIYDYAEDNHTRIKVEKRAENSVSYIFGNGRGKWNVFREGLSCYNLIKNKHIPDDYIYNSRKNRLELLAGIIDTDGYYSKEYNVFEIVQKKKIIAEKLQYLCQTLGFGASINQKEAVCTNNGAQSVVYRVRIYGDIDQIPTRIPRKKARKSLKRDNHLVTGITVEFDKYDEYFGFTLDQDGLFLLEDTTVTHNTAMVVQLIRNMTRRFPVGFVNGEMTQVQMCVRWCCNYADIPNEALKIIPGKPLEIPEELKWRYQQALLEFTKQQLHMESDMKDIDKIISRIHYWVKTLGCKVIIVDYLQIIEIREELMKYMTEVQALNYILRRLRETAKRLKVPIIVLSQLNRDLYKRGGSKEPGLSDLKGSGMIEEVAYQIAFLHRPEYYNIKEDEYSENTHRLAYLIIAKHRDGPMGRVMLKALLPMSKFVPWESDYIPWIPEPKKGPAGQEFNAGTFDEGYEEAAPF